MEINKWYDQALNMADATNNVKVLNKIHLLFSSFKNNKIPQTKMVELTFKLLNVECFDNIINEYEKAVKRKYAFLYSVAEKAIVNLEKNKSNISDKETYKKVLKSLKLYTKTLVNKEENIVANKAFEKLNFDNESEDSALFNMFIEKLDADVIKWRKHYKNFYSSYNLKELDEYFEHPKSADESNTKTNEAVLLNLLSKIPNVTENHKEA